MFLRPATHRMIIRYDPEIGFKYVPGLRARIPNELGGYYVRTNASGFRSDIEFRKARDTRPRILFFGDSYTAGDGCSNHERFSERVGEALNAEVYNYGLAGSGTDQQALIFERSARDVEADLIVLGIQVENIERITATHRETLDRASGARVLVPKPYFTLVNDRLELHHVPVPVERPVVDTRLSVSNGSTHWLDWSIRLYRRSRWAKKAAQFLERSPGAIRSGRIQRLRHVLKWTGYQPFPGYATHEHHAWKLMRALIERFHAMSSPIPLLIVPIPNYYFYLYGVKPAYQALFNSLASPERGLHVSDLTNRISAMPEDVRERLSFQHDPHFSPFGHEHVARFLQEDIERKRLLPSRLPTVSVSDFPKRPSVKRPTYVLGLSCFYHDSAAALIKDGTLVAAAEEERFSRVKNDRRFPHLAANFCLEQAGLQQQDLSAVVYYDNASLTFERIMHNLLALAPDGEEAWLRIIPSWMRYKLHIPQLIRRALRYDGLVLQDHHHRSHAASAFYPSPFERAALLTVDGVGEWATASIALGATNQVQMLKQMNFPHSLGLLYSAFTQFTGFKVNDGEYKMMGLAPYGEPTYVNTILDHLVDLKEDGSLRLNLDYFSFLSGSTMTSPKFGALFGGPAREGESRITQREMDLARSVQVVTEECMLRMARHAHQLTGERHLCLAGGVALNCVANGRLLREGPFERLWIQPAAGDAGGALGAAFDAYHHYLDHADGPLTHKPSQGASLLGPEFSAEEIRAFLESHGYPHRELAPGERAPVLAGLLEEGKVVGHFSGRAEFGPRALGARSILADARNAETQVNLNLKIKYRESFRPFAPAVLAEKAKAYFDLEGESPYMLIVAPVKESRRKRPPDSTAKDDLLPIVRQERSDIPAVTHVDYSARIQTVRREDHFRYYTLIEAFEKKTGCAVIVNTSFNVRGEPVVLTPYDAYRCFMRTEMDVLVLGDYLLEKEAQPEWPETKGHLEREQGPMPGQVPAEILSALRKLYVRDFLPVWEQLGEEATRRILANGQGRSSMWEDMTRDQTPKTLYAIPHAMDTPAPNPDLMAQALTDSWSPGPVTDALRPVITQLIRLGLRCPASEELDEEVSDSVYVMF